MNETISVIIPMYNCADLIGKSLESLRAQTYADLEIILVDNASTDDTLKTAYLAAEKDSRIKVYHTDEKGVSLARNLGVENASGKYIAFMDADDYVKPDMYEYLLKLLKKSGADIAACNIFYINKHSSKVYNEKQTEKFLKSFDAIKECLANPSVFVSVWNKLYKRETVENIRFPLVGMSEDLQFLYDVFSGGASMICGFEPKYYYDKSINNPYFAQRDLDSLKVFEYILKREFSLGKEKRIKFFKNQYLKHLYSLLIKASLYPLRASPDVVIRTARKEYFGFIFAKGISLKLKLFAAICLINKKLAKWINKHFIRK